ncbi:MULTISPECIES: ROK family protein [unclassified Streptomyces]|uniref:ROK family protein n=1 Tax=unclassified Streptomyces TaxID=2593676 RepID=UPI002DDA50FF|nr:ROK family protein [Streptomyces sp. NBC_00243]WRZ18856.1 ROK family protein [Streptomyces sp. NBC_00243]WTB43120.1 ROK family protein [Streptomyces sp. NBC_00827]
MKAGPSQEEIRRHNLGTLLRHVHIGGSMSRAVLAERMGLNRSTILGLVSELGSAGLVREELPRETGRAGRPSLVVRPESDRVYVLAFDVGVDRLAAARIGLGGVFLDRREISVLPGRRNAGKVAEVLAGSALEMMSTAPHGTYCVGVAAAVRGMVRRPDGLVRAVPYLGWEDEEFGQDLTRQLGLGLPVSVGNEASLGALAEHLRGAGTGCQDLVYLHGDIGIGGGVITGGQLLSGDRGYGGEIGHMVVNPRNGRPCGCGARGCLEAEAGERALLEAAQRDPSATGREAVRAVVEAADRGDITARAALHDVGDWLGIGVANLVNVLNPRTVIFGGTLREVFLGSAAQIRSRINRIALTPSRENLRLRVGELGDDAVLVGAAELAFSEILVGPLETLARAGA